MNEFEGHCLCDGVRFAAAPPTLSCVHCHCRYCRRAHGAAFVTWFSVPQRQFRFLAGEDQVTWYASSPQSRRGFCSRCGTTMFYTSTLSPGEIDIARSCVEGPIDREPRVHLFFDQRVEWLMIRDHLPRVDGTSEALRKYRVVAPLPPPR